MTPRSAQQLYQFVEADGCSDNTAAPTVDRPQLGRGVEIATYRARNCFESIMRTLRISGMTM